MSNKTILAINGSLRKNSSNQWVLDNFVQPFLEQTDGFEYQQYTDVAALPLFNEDSEDNPGYYVENFRETAERASGFVLITPEYNAGPSGAIKNLLDWASRPVGEGAFKDKPVLVLGASPTEYGAVLAQQALLDGLSIVGAKPVYKKPTALAQSHRVYSQPESFENQYKSTVETALKSLLEV